MCVCVCVCACVCVRACVRVCGTQKHVGSGQSTVIINVFVVCEIVDNMQINLMTSQEQLVEDAQLEL